MKRVLVTTILALMMAMMSSVAFAAQIVELNETYSLEQTREAVNTYLAKDTRFYSSMHRIKDPNDYICANVSTNQRNWKFLVYQNGQGYACNVGMIIPGDEDTETIARAGTSLLVTATGKGYGWGNKAMYPIVKASLGAIKYGKSEFYCNDTHRYYELNTKYNDRDNNWYLIVLAFVYN